MVGGSRRFCFCGFVFGGGGITHFVSILTRRYHLSQALDVIHGLDQTHRTLGVCQDSKLRGRMNGLSSCCERLVGFGRTFLSRSPGGVGGVHRFLKVVHCIRGRGPGTRRPREVFCVFATGGQRG